MLYSVIFCSVNQLSRSKKKDGLHPQNSRLLKIDLLLCSVSDPNQIHSLIQVHICDFFIQTGIRDKHIKLADRTDIIEI